MLAGLWTGIGGKLAERLVATILTPAFVFWAGGLLAWADAEGGSDGWMRVEDWFTARPSSVQAALVVGALLLLTVSGLVVEHLTLPVLRFVEGYWPRWAEGARRPLVARKRRLRDRLGERLQALAPKLIEGSATLEEWREYADLDRRLRQFPAQRWAAPDRMMPTRLGNALRAAESRPRDRYELDAVKCWPSLWLVLPEAAKTELAGARARLDAGAATWLWSALFLVWTVWAWWAPLVAVGGLLASYVWMLRAADVFGELVNAAFDVHRGALYKALRWRLPRNAEEEQVQGRALTEYLWWGSDSAAVEFASAAEPAKATETERA